MQAMFSLRLYDTVQNCMACEITLTGPSQSCTSGSTPFANCVDYANDPSVNTYNVKL